MLPKRLSLPPMCQPMEAKLTHPPLPTQRVSFFFDLGDCPPFLYFLFLHWSFLWILRFLIGWFMCLIIFFVVDVTLGFSFHIQKAMCYTLHKMGSSGGLHWGFFLSWDKDTLFSLMKLLNSESPINC